MTINKSTKITEITFGEQNLKYSYVVANIVDKSQEYPKDVTSYVVDDISRYTIKVTDGFEAFEKQTFFRENIEAHKMFKQFFTTFLSAKYVVVDAEDIRIEFIVKTKSGDVARDIVQNIISGDIETKNNGVKSHEVKNNKLFITINDDTRLGFNINDKFIMVPSGNLLEYNKMGIDFLNIIAENNSLDGIKLSKTA